jgi:plastocyanin
VSVRTGPGIVAALGALGWFAAAYRPADAQLVRSARPHRASSAPQRSLGACPPSAGFKAGSVADHGVATAGGRTIALEAGDSYFEPTCETGVPLGEVEVQVKNTGRLLHNISFEDPAIDQDVAPGETVTVTVRMGTEPRQFSCKYHRGAGMVGALLPGGVRTTR